MADAAITCNMGFPFYYPFILIKIQYLFIKFQNRLDEYKRFYTLAHLYGLESHILGPEETVKLFPLLNPKAFYGSLYSPADGVVDPSMLCTALVKAATKNGGQVSKYNLNFSYFFNRIFTAF